MFTRTRLELFNAESGEGAWRFLDTEPAAGAWNMAVDEALAESVAAGGPPVLRFYRWNPACLSLGRNQPGRGRYNEAELRRRGIDVVRRPTGGRAVLHDRELTYSVAVADGMLGPPRTAYAAINHALVAGLRRLGVDAALQGSGGGPALPPSLAPCFEHPSEGEIVANGRKLVGSAQRRMARTLLQHGSLLIEDDQRDVRTLLKDGASHDVPDEAAPATLALLLGRVPSWTELTEALAAGWSDALRAPLRSAPLTAPEIARTREHAARYGGAAWTWHL